MNLRKTFAIGAAILASGVLGLMPTATASTPTGAAPTAIVVDASVASGYVPYTGTFAGGTASYSGGSYGCVSGTVSGTIRRGAWAPTDEMIFPTLNLTCATPFGINAVITMDTGCSAKVNIDSAATNVHPGAVDTGTGTKFHRVPGEASIDHGCPARIRVLGNLCTARVSGTVDAYFDETVKTGGVQTLGLTSIGLSLSGGTGLCTSILNGPFSLNNVEFDTAATVDFQ